MCVDPATAVMVSTGISAIGSMASGVMKASEARANAAALETAAQQRQEKAKFDIERADVQYRRQLGSVQARIGTTGIDTSSFSSVLADDAKESALQKQAIQVGADVESQNLRFQAGGQRMSATSDIVSGAFGAAAAVGKGYGQLATLDANNARIAARGGVSIGSGFGEDD